MTQELFATTTTFDGGKTLKIGSMILIAMDFGGPDVFLYAASVGSVSTTGPQEIDVVGKGSNQDFDELYVASAESYFSYATGKTAANLANLEWIFLSDA